MCGHELGDAAALDSGRGIISMPPAALKNAYRRYQPSDDWADDLFAATLPLLEAPASSRDAGEPRA